MSEVSSKVGRTGPAAVILRSTHELFEDLLNQKNVFEEIWKECSECKREDETSDYEQREKILLENAIIYNDMLEDHLKRFIRSEQFILSLENCNRASSVISVRLAQRFLVFSHSQCVNALKLYRKGITADTRGFLLDRHGPKNSFTHRYAFDINLLGSVFSCGFTDEGIHALAKSKLRQQNISKGAWSFQINKSGRAFLLGLAIHFTNWLANLHSQIIEKKMKGNTNAGLNSLKEVDMDLETLSNCIENIEDSSSKTITQVIEKESSVYMEYCYPDMHCKWFQEVIWKNVTDAVQELGRSVVDQKLKITPTDGIVHVKPKRGSRREVLVCSHMVDANFVFKNMSNPSNISVLLCQRFVEGVVYIFIHEGQLSANDLRKTGFSYEFKNNLRELYRNVFQTIEYSASSEIPTAFDWDKIKTIFELGFDQFLSSLDQNWGSYWKIGIQDTEFEKKKHTDIESNKDGYEEHGKIMNCPLCKQKWPKNRKWPPSVRKFEDTVETDAEDPEEVTNLTARCVKRSKNK